MNNVTPNAVSCLWAFGLVLATGCHPAKEPAPWAAKVVRVVGEARYTTNNGADWLPLQAGTILPESSVLQTARGEHNYADIVLGDGPGQNHPRMSRPPADRDRVRLHADTALGLDKRASATVGPSIQTETQLDLRRGHITGSVAELAADSSYEIKYATGIAGLREAALVYDMSRPDPAGGGQTNLPCILAMWKGRAVMVPGQSGATPMVIGPGFGFNDLTHALTALSEAAKQDISATVESMH